MKIMYPRGHHYETFVATYVLGRLPSAGSNESKEC